MTKIRFVDQTGTEIVIEAEDGRSAMHAALENDVPGIGGDCGGVCACATCHGYVDPTWLARLGPISPIEEDMLDMVDERKPNSRLLCQIIVDRAIDGLIIETPQEG